jgi:hypothetical protein
MGGKTHNLKQKGSNFLLESHVLILISIKEFKCIKYFLHVNILDHCISKTINIISFWVCMYGGTLIVDQNKCLNQCNLLIVTHM